MALTIANTHPQAQALSFGGLNGRLVTVTFDSSYASGGESLTPSDVGMSEFLAVIPLPDANALEGNIPVYDYTAQKLMVLGSGTTGAVLDEAGADDLSTLVVRVLCLGY